MQCCILGLFLKTISSPTLGSYQTHFAESSETRIRSWDSDLQRNKWDLCISLLLMPAAGVAAIDGDGDESELLQGDLLESSKLIYPKQGNSHIETVKQQQAIHIRLLEFASTHLEVQGRTSTLITTS
jgi:hypothetical protein